MAVNTLILLGLLAFVAAGVEGSMYEPPMDMYEPHMDMYKPPAMKQKREVMPDSRCKHVGQLLTKQDDQCSYLVCDYGNEPWKDKYGNVKLFTTKMPCAPGTFVHGGSGGYHVVNPCNGRDDKMCLPKKKHHYGMFGSARKAVMDMDTMVDKQKMAISMMDSSEVIKMVKALGKMLQNQMYSVTELKSKSDENKMMEMKQEMRGMYQEVMKKPEPSYRGKQKKTTEMKKMCYKMLDMMKEVVKMKKEMEEVKNEMKSYGKPQTSMMGMSKWMPKEMQVTMKMQEMSQSYKPMMMAMPMKNPYMAMEEMQAEEPKGYGKPKMKKPKVKEIMMMMEKVMKMMEESGYGMEPMAEMTSGYGKMEEMMEEMQAKPMMTGYGKMEEMMMKPMMSGYGKMEETKPMMMGYGKMEEMKMKPMMTGYGKMEEMKPMMTGYGKMEEMKPMMTGYGKMEEMKPMMTGYGKMEEMEMKPQTMYGYAQMEGTQTKAPSAGYGQMEEMKPSMMMSGYGSMEEMMAGYGKMEEMKLSEMMSGYGKMEEMKPSEMMSGYGRMEQMKMKPTSRPVVYVIVPKKPKEETMQQKPKPMKYWA